MTAGTTPAPAVSLTGLKVLVVEDMFLIAEDLAEQLSTWGCEVVGPDRHVKGALQSIANSHIDGALLDVNLDGETSFEIASTLASRNTPFIFLTGYDSEKAFPAEFHSAPKLSKPVVAEALQAMIRRHFLNQA
ncbi:MAG: response regulator [Mesorhizobium sp.]